MIRKDGWWAFCAAALVLLAAGPVHAASFTVAGTSSYDEYKITSYPGQTDPSVWLPVYPISGYPGYVSDRPDGSISGGSPGTYTYTTWFSLDGYDPATAQLTGYMVADDSVSLTLNGQSVPGGGYGWPWYGTFTISSGFVSGTNTLSFNLWGDGSWVYLSVQDMTVTASPAVPLPSTIWMVLSGLGGLGCFRKLSAWRGRRRSV
ncbi:MAG: hypothetical protein HY900_08330 [Deltaproteobacteria bacterium]|nr:hypothetical protein [Deltaproteobacteria bacterium]